MDDQKAPSPTHVELPIDLLNHVILYLVKRPFEEVFDLVVPLKNAADASFKARSESASGDQTVPPGVLAERV